jgi:hypothetical protein
MNAHQVDYHIIGDDIQIVEVELDPGGYRLYCRIYHRH